EENEGIDDPGEFDVFNPFGNDRPFSTVDDLKLLDAIPDNDPDPQFNTPPSLFQILRNSTTIYSQSDQISGPLSGKNSEVAKINPNLISNWRPSDVWNIGDPVSNRVDFQYSPPVRIEDLIPAFQVDQDGDWQKFAEPDVINGKGDGIDNDGDGLIDEPSDDWDGNFFASGDFDGYSEPDTSSIALRNGVDDDGDGQTQDEPRAGQNIVRRLRGLGETERPRDEQDIQLRRGMVGEGDGVGGGSSPMVPAAVTSASVARTPAAMTPSAMTAQRCGHDSCDCVTL
ncbi:MAG: hypothetical protein IH863_04295, partial [Chloroflexi bacterium]|nr:hypothetical protein [Chloroflexota bacterium]